MQEVYYAATEKLMIQLLIGKLVRHYNQKSGIKVSRFIGIIDGEKRIYQFKDSDNMTTECYNTESTIFYLDYDWSSFNDNINKAKDIKLRGWFLNDYKAYK